MKFVKFVKFVKFIKFVKFVKLSIVKAKRVNLQLIERMRDNRQQSK